MTAFPWRLTSDCNCVDYGMNSTTKYSSAVQVLALCKFAGVQPRLLQALLQHFGNLERIIRADSGKLMVIDGMTAEAANKITKSAKFLSEAQGYHEDLTGRDITVTTRFDNDYPDLLFELNDPPPLLYVRGRLPDKAKKSVALVGSSKATNEGIELTVKLTRSFAAAGVQVISSLDSGIGAAAHVGSKTAEGISFSVLESGIDQLDLTEAVPLAVDIVEHGGVISEYAPEEKFHEGNHVSANRLIVGLSQAVVVTQVYHDSKRTLDLLTCCGQIGKLAYVMIDPRHGALADEDSLSKAVSCGAIPMVGLDKVDDIIKSLV